MAQRTGYSLDALIDSLGDLAFLNKSQLYDAMYPVGICIMFDSNTNPNNTMPGTTWVAIADGYTIRAAPTPQIIGMLGGNDTATLSVDNMPAHSHDWSGSSSAAGAANLTTGTSGDHNHSISTTLATNGNHTHNVSGSVSNAGGHNHGASGDTSNDGVHTHDFTAHTSEDGSHQHGVPQGQNNGNDWNGNRRYTSGDDNTDIMLTNNQNQWPLTSGDGTHNHSIVGTTNQGGRHNHILYINVDSVNDHSHSFNVTSGSAGAHSHSASSSSNTTGAHTHSVTIGNHSHTVSGTNSNTGGGQFFSVMNKTRLYGIWKRTA